MAERSPQEIKSVPHSGNLPEDLREQPVNNFDNTTLSEAHEQGHIITPDSPAPLVDRQEVKKKSGRRGLMIGLGAGAAGIAIAAGAIFGVNALNQGPRNDPIATAPADPTETSAPTETETENQPLEQIEISATTAPEELGNAFDSRFNSWMMAGTENPDLQNDMLKAIAEGNVTGYGEYLQPLSEKNATEYADALFVDGWQDNPDLKKWVDLFTKNNAASVETWAQTKDSGISDDKEPFKYWTTIESTTVTSSSADSISISSEMTEHANINENRSLELDPNLINIDGNELTLEATFVPAGDSLKISAFNISFQ